MTQNKREKFLKLAEHRTNEVLRKLNTLGHCSNRSAYEYNDKDIVKIFTAIENKTREIKSKFRVGKKDNFKF